MLGSLTIIPTIAPQRYYSDRLLEGFETELGYFDLTELSEVTVLGGVPAVERDLYWEPQTLGEIRRQASGLAA